MEMMMIASTGFGLLAVSGRLGANPVVPGTWPNLLSGDVNVLLLALVLFLAVSIEYAVLAAMVRKELGRLLAYSLLINASTLMILPVLDNLGLPQLSFFAPFVPDPLSASVVLGELVVAAAEMCALKLLLRVPWPRAAILSVAANAASLVGGWLLIPTGIWGR